MDHSTTALSIASLPTNDVRHKTLNAIAWYSLTDTVQVIVSIGLSKSVSQTQVKWELILILKSKVLSF